MAFLCNEAIVLTLFWPLFNTLVRYSVVWGKFLGASVGRTLFY